MIELKCYFCQDSIEFSHAIMGDSSGFTDFKCLSETYKCSNCPHNTYSSYTVSYRDDEIYKIELYKASINISNNEIEFLFTIDLKNNTSKIIKKDYYGSLDVYYDIDILIQEFNFIANINPNNIVEKLPVYITFS